MAFCLDRAARGTSMLPMSADESTRDLAQAQAMVHARIRAHLEQLDLPARGCGARAAELIRRHLAARPEDFESLAGDIQVWGVARARSTIEDDCGLDLGLDRKEVAAGLRLLAERTDLIERRGRSCYACGIGRAVRTQAGIVAPDMKAGHPDARLVAPDFVSARVEVDNRAPSPRMVRYLRRQGVVAPELLSAAAAAVMQRRLSSSPGLLARRRRAIDVGRGEEYQPDYASRVAAAAPEARWGVPERSLSRRRIAAEARGGIVRLGARIEGEARGITERDRLGRYQRRIGPTPKEWGQFAA